MPMTFENTCDIEKTHGMGRPIKSDDEECVNLKPTGSAPPPLR